MHYDVFSQAIHTEYWGPTPVFPQLLEVDRDPRHAENDVRLVLIASFFLSSQIVRCAPSSCRCSSAALPASSRVTAIFFIAGVSVFRSSRILFVYSCAHVRCADTSLVVCSFGMRRPKFDYVGHRRKQPTNRFLARSPCGCSPSNSNLKT
jgi:hypothetical protein